MTQLSSAQRKAAIAYLLDNLDNETLVTVRQVIASEKWPGDWHFGFGTHVRNLLRKRFDWDDLLLDSEWVSLVEQAVREYNPSRQPENRSMKALPPLPPRLQSAALAAAENLAFIAADEGIQLGGPHGEATPHLVTLLYTVRECCVAAEREPRPYLGDTLITAQEIAAVLETIALLLQSDGSYELAGRNPSWFSDAALLVERLARPVDE
ncbi:MAG: hypothetical protein FOGNACKC_06245 [Anaerolineae bacterium]|nr:hypothetical protein [Anaerolineae bacterium]